MDFSANKPQEPPKPNQPPPFGSDNTSHPGVSHSPLDLGAGSTAESPRIAAPKLVEAAPKPVEKKITEKTIPTDRTTGVKTFFTKLHSGAIEFLDEQITAWLKQNPGISIKHTNIVTGEIQGKKTEPNIIITVWY
jgi:hypothetical protein